MKISLSLWSMSQACVEADVQRYDSIVDSYHVDVSDGSLADSLLFAPMHVAALRELTDKPIVAHLMVERPQRWLGFFAEAGATVIAVHVPATSVDGAVDAIADTGALPALALTLAQRIEPFGHAFERLAQVIVMGTHLGIKGASLHRGALRNLHDVNRLVERTQVEVYVDGGIRQPLLPSLKAAGADGVVAGSILADSRDPHRMAGVIRRL